MNSPFYTQEETEAQRRPVTSALLVTGWRGLSQELKRICVLAERASLCLLKLQVIISSQYQVFQMLHYLLPTWRRRCCNGMVLSQDTSGTWQLNWPSHLISQTWRSAMVHENDAFGSADRVFWSTIDYESWKNLEAAGEMLTLWCWQFQSNEWIQVHNLKRRENAHDAGIRETQGFGPLTPPALPWANHRTNPKLKPVSFSKIPRRY